MLHLAFLLLAASAAPPPQDDDDERVQRGRPPIAVPKPDDYRGGPTHTYQPAGSTRPDDDDRPKTSSAPPGPGATDQDDDEGNSRAPASSAIVITARQLDAARTRIDSSLGASVYSLTNDTIENRPGGETGKLADILTQAPGVTVSGTTIDVRGSRANQVRINNVIVPEAISDPADLISSRLAETTRLITGTLPAQFGFAPAGVISITTKDGLYQHGGEAEMFAGSDGMIEPAFEWAGSAARTSLFASGELEHDRTVVADVAGHNARDRRADVDGLGFADYVFDSENRVSLIFGGSHEYHKFGVTDLGPGTEINDNAYGVATYQHSSGGLTMQTSLFDGIGSDETHFAHRTRERLGTWGMQIDASEVLKPSHIVGFGLLASRSIARDLQTDGERSNTSRTSIGVYAQDEWKLNPSLTFNPGVRLEWPRGFHSATKVEPRASLVWEAGDGLSAHVGYARYASAPPLGEENSKVLPDERDDYFDAGLQQKLGALTLGLDGYWRRARNYLDQHQTPGTAVTDAFAFRRARIKGIELSATYARHGTTAWASLSLSQAEAKGIIGGEALFAPETIAAASTTYIPLASDRPVTASGGFTQRVGKFSFGGNVQVSSGAVRTSSLADPNGSRHSRYALLGLAAVYHARILNRGADVRLDLTNLTSVSYDTTDTSVLEGGWTRRGRGRTLTIGIEQQF